MQLKTKVGSLAAAGLLIFAVAGTTSAVTKWATPDDWYASTPGDGSNEASFWENRFDLDAGDCHKLTAEELDGVMNEDGSASLGVAYEFVVVKQANPNAKDVTYDNTIFEGVAADETVFADTNGDGSYTDADSNGISHIIVCGPVTTTTSSEESTTTSSEESTTSSEESTTTSSEESTTTSSEESTTSSEESTTTSSEETTSFSSSEESTTTSSEDSSTTSFNSSQESSTITQPPTDAIGNSGSGNQATGMWLLVAALGVLLGSLVVVAPARVKNKR